MPDSNLLVKIAKENGVKNAYEYLKAKAVDPLRAHDLAHFIGVLSYQNEGQNGVAICDGNFSFGCFHGFFEALISTERKGALDEANLSCASLSPAGKVASCVHGIGHGVFAWKRDVNSSLKQCEKLPPLEKIYCFDGVFMEFYTGVMTTNEKPESQIADSWKFCLGLETKYQSQCARNHTFYLFSLGKSTSVPTRCAELPENLRGMCIQSVGLRAAQSTIVDRTLCDIFKDINDRSYCFVSAAQELTFQGKDNGEELCKELSGEWAKRCKDTIAFTKSLYH